MRLFVSEYLCSGACADAEQYPSLVREGRSMLEALLADFARVDGCQVWTTWDARLGPAPAGVHAAVVRDADDEVAAFAELCRVCDAGYVIAPETGGVLAARVNFIAQLGGRSLNASVAAIELCGDKWALSQHLARHELSAIPTALMANAAAFAEGYASPLVVKPRCGAGSQDTYFVADAATWELVIARHATACAAGNMIVQPFVAGRAASVAVLMNAAGKCAEVWPVAEQRLSLDGRFQYLGGRVPAAIECGDAVASLVRRAMESIPGLQGYVGCDVIIPDAPPTEPILVEINPRLTTSYLGYRQLSTSNLAARMLAVAGAAIADRDASARLGWKPGQVCFAVDGVVAYSPPASP